MITSLMTSSDLLVSRHRLTLTDACLYTVNIKQNNIFLKNENQQKISCCFLSGVVVRLSDLRLAVVGRVENLIRADIKIFSKATRNGIVQLLKLCLCKWTRFQTIQQYPKTFGFE